MSERGAYREHRPPADLRDYVACTWSQTLTGSPARTMDIIPDGCVDLVVIEGQIHIAGPATVTQQVQPGACAITGLRLRPGAARAVLSCPVDRLLDQDTELRAVCGRAALALEAGVSDDQTATRRALEQWVRARVADSQRPLAAVAAGLISDDPRRSLDDVLLQLDLSARTLHRELSASCGYGPKLLQRIMRVQRTLRLTEHGATCLAELAARMGYADQAHMTRDFRALTGTTPARYLASYNREVGRWLGEPE